MSNDITLYNPTTGEVLALVVREASDEQLADVVEARIPELREQLGKAAEIVTTEWLRRLDRSGRWTRRVGEVEDKVQWVIRSSSPNAGATETDLELLDDLLQQLVADDVIDQEAADSALERTVTVVYQASTPEEIARLIETKGAGAVDVRSARKIRDAGVRALLKVPAAAEHVLAAGVIRDVEPPRRRLSIKRIDARPGREQ